MKSSTEIKNETKTDIYLENITTAIQSIKTSDAIVVGIGAGLSASGGVSYMDPMLVNRWFPDYAKLGFKSLAEIQSLFWRLSDKNVLAYWGYWARHINFIRYQLPVLEPYSQLKEILANRKHFIITTNADGQIQKAGFDKAKIFAPQGNYDLFQCSVPCSWETLYPNEDMITNMVASVNEKQEIDAALIPRCPNCGNSLIPNLRCDDKFVEKPHLKNFTAYQTFIQENSENSLFFLELGVGYNTPGIIRFPFEQMTGYFKNAHLLRINLGMAAIPDKISCKAIGIDADSGQVLKDIKKGIEHEYDDETTRSTGLFNSRTNR